MTFEGDLKREREKKKKKLLILPPPHLTLDRMVLQVHEVREAEGTNLFEPLQNVLIFFSGVGEKLKYPIQSSIFCQICTHHTQHHKADMEQLGMAKRNSCAQIAR